MCYYVKRYVLYLLYFLVLKLIYGVNWTIHLWLGTTFVAGIVGLLVSFNGAAKGTRGRGGIDIWLIYQNIQPSKTSNNTWMKSA